MSSDHCITILCLNSKQFECRMVEDYKIVPLFGRHCDCNQPYFIEIYLIIFKIQSRGHNMPGVPCCVPDCKDKTSSRHRFPVPRTEMKRFREWIKLIGNPKLVNMDPVRVYNSYRVCNQHFTLKFLNSDTLPSEKLPRRKVLDDDSDEEDDDSYEDDVSDEEDDVSDEEDDDSDEEETISVEKESLNKKESTDKKTTRRITRNSSDVKQETKKRKSL